jgi:hypothetical protein
MNRQIHRLILLIMVLFITALTAGCGGTPIRGGSAYFDMHHRNPWYGYHGALPLPHYLGPPPVVMPTGIPDLPPPAATP